MKISGFTFIRNGVILGYPFVESIKSILDICDEFIVNVGSSSDNTIDRIKGINSSKIRIIESVWNDKLNIKGYTYAQQKMIAQYSCTGDWLFYLEGDEVVHENDLDKIVHTMKRSNDNKHIEAISFDYFHFYGNHHTIAVSPRWYRREARIIRGDIRTICPDSLFWCVLGKRNTLRGYPRAVHSGAKIYHYGWVRTQEQMNARSKQVQKYWGNAHRDIDYGEVDPRSLSLFEGSHPSVMNHFLPKHAKREIFKTNPNYKLTWREKRHRFLMMLEKTLKMDFSKKHYIPVSNR
ncbi:hypothetical protein [Desulforhabdus amnigena]|jgi:hypothetical protein|uniref:Uncharacterized protein n=1 Tax=Desulforhabdus amnigena TaxID=40218 RepID=A0A9W6CZR9_9BACT|nr:hypothetical protein [Desulforhabdus amnigena]NLJ29188.1 glycosyltransferase [Deltaproteobacteria bacterium]GLI32653.1 hypothetical protein DAMNIGENAA_00860 [Desulforhabdus amnigena]